MGPFLQIVPRTFRESWFPQIGGRALAGLAGRVLVLFLLLSGGALFGQEEKPELPPEEDETFAEPRDYAFNPVQAEKELKVARFYMKKGNPRAAALRAQEALKWDNTLLDAYLVLGEAREKTTDADGALKAYRQYLELAEEQDKERRNVQKRVEHLSRQLAKESGTTKPPKP